MKRDPTFDANDFYEVVESMKYLPEPVQGYASMILMEPALNLMQALVKCESPIEQLVYCALALRQRDIGSGREYRVLPQQWVRSAAGDNRYRVDFIVEDVTAGRMVAVECDGFEFHETPEAATRDKARDRQIQTTGLPVLRFTGKEIWAQPYTCAREILQALTAQAAVS